MTKIQPFGCDVRKASDEEKREFLELLDRYAPFEHGSPSGQSNFYGITRSGSWDGYMRKYSAKGSFKQIIPISEGIAILKQALGEEEQPKENDGWISVKDRLPKIGKDYLVTDGQACMVSAFRVKKQAWDFWSLTFWSSDHVTHWMPLPKRPNS